MAWNNAGGLVVAGRGQVLSAAVGTALPTSPTAVLNAAFVGVGFHTDDGVSTNYQPEFEEIMGWQSAYPLRRFRTGEAFELTFSLLQWDENSTPLAFGGGVISTITGGYKYTPPGADDAIVEKSLVCDVQDGVDVIRFVVPRGTTTENVESQFKRSSAAELPVTFKSLEAPDGGPSWYFLTSSADYAAGS